MGWKPLSIARFGATTMAAFRRGITSIIEMATRLTMPWTICSASPVGSICLPTHQSLSAKRGPSIGLSASDLWQPNGTGHLKVENGTRSMEGMRGSDANLSIDNANIVARLFKRLLQASPSSATTTAKVPPVVRLARIGKNALVSFVAKCLRRTDTFQRALVPVSVVGLVKAGRSSVYNLTVEGTHEYFAEGVLVANCDAARYLLMAHQEYSESTQPFQEFFQTRMEQVRPGDGNAMVWAARKAEADYGKREDGVLTIGSGARALRRVM